MRESDARASSRRILLAAVRSDPRSLHDLFTDHIERIDWNWMLDRAAAHKVAALLAFRIDRCGLTHRLPTEIQARLECIRNQARDRATQARWTLQQLARVLASKGVPFLVVKGSVLAEDVYRDPVLRPFDDVDIVVREEQLGPAEEAMRALGYRFVSATIRQLRWYGQPIDGPLDGEAPEDVGRAFFRRVHYHFAFEPTDPGLMPVDLHWHIGRPWLLRFDSAELWRHTRPSRVASTSVSTLTPEAMLLHTATHAMSDSVFAFRLLHLVDIAWILERFGETVDADRVWALAGDWGVRGDLACALQALRDVLVLNDSRSLAYRRYQTALHRSLFRLVGNARTLVDQEWPDGRVARLGSSLFAETVWEVARRRLPRNGARTAASAVGATWEWWRRRLRRSRSPYRAVRE